MRSHRRTTIAGAVLAIGLLLAGSVPATAAAGPTTLPANQFTLSADYHRFDAVNSALVSTLGTAPVHTVMDNANHSRKKPPQPVPISGVTGSFQFDDTDNKDCTNYPQGITTSRDAVGTADNGTYDGHQLVLVSWYTRASCTDKTQTRSRTTLVDWDATYPDKYRKVLLVEPTGSTSTPDFRDITVHAGGVAWYGNYLYVADTGRGMRVFDLRKILKTDPGGNPGQIGRQSATTYYAHNYAYVLPQVGIVTSNTTAEDKLVWSSISLDRATKSLVMNEYTCKSGCRDYPNRAPRAVRFPFAPSSTAFAANTTASQALQLPWYKLNGGASHNGRWWFNSSGDHKLYYWAAATGSKSYPWVSSGESISYWEDETKPDLLWSLQEGVGNRNVFAVGQAGYSG
ncbi:hypothetical protein [Amycolatopsis panacis]|uniref:Secreted protein n=1 Tax=Amycolatopsis panacis TaxID=2340917 RepID=A0A419HKJ9_9PSEU|nr:hypothetical protein [Amycolatopsis panacis]RJQ76476.1 hypothetical protein D5S19_30435 [Amycolatopsis panacis]